jgi:outer membrane protein OmpA-like peptidoglycan-associated protein
VAATNAAALFPMKEDLPRMKLSDIIAIILVFGLTACSGLGSSSSGKEEAELVENGYVALSAGDYRTAENLLERALAFNTKNPFTWLNLGVVYQDTHRYAKARHAYQTVIDLKPSQTAIASNVKEYSGKNLADIAKINMANLPSATAKNSLGQDSSDMDGDGVPDDLDQCNNTPAKAMVADNGCWTLIDIFESGKAQIRPEADQQLDAVAAILKANPSLHLEIQGHTDDRGSNDMNQRLSEERAQSVNDYLIRKGIAADRLNWVGFGQSRPVASNDTASGRKQNRRVELVPIPGD